MQFYPRDARHARPDSIGTQVFWPRLGNDMELRQWPFDLTGQAQIESPEPCRILHHRSHNQNAALEPCNAGSAQCRSSSSAGRWFHPEYLHPCSAGDLDSSFGEDTNRWPQRNWMDSWGHCPCKEDADQSHNCPFCLFRRTTDAARRGYIFPAWHARRRPERQWSVCRVGGQWPGEQEPCQHAYDPRQKTPETPGESEPPHRTQVQSALWIYVSNPPSDPPYTFVNNRTSCHAWSNGELSPEIPPMQAQRKPTGRNS